MVIMDILQTIWVIIQLFIIIVGSPFLCYRAIKSSRELRIEAHEIMGTVRRSVTYRNANYGKYHRYESMTEKNYLKQALAVKKRKQSTFLFVVGILSGLFFLLVLKLMIEEIIGWF